MYPLSISIDVPDLQRASHFYIAAFGFDEGPSPGAGMAKIRTGNVDLYLLERHEGSPTSKGSSDRRRYQRHWTPVHFDVLVQDLQHALSTAVAAGAIHESSDSDDWGAIAVCSDPWGNGFCLIEERGS